MKRWIFLLILLASCSFLAEEEAVIEPEPLPEPEPEPEYPEGAEPCEVIPEFCQERYDPVCGDDENTYSSGCTACLAEVNWYTPGKCPVDTSVFCDDIPATCTKQYDPVCADNSETYSNPCVACQEDIAWFTKGACPEEENIFIPCAGDRPEYCTKEYAPVCGKIDTGIRCIKEPCPSTKYETYGNKCDACSNDNVLGYTVGECSSWRG